MKVQIFFNLTYNHCIVGKPINCAEYEIDGDQSLFSIFLEAAVTLIRATQPKRPHWAAARFYTELHENSNHWRYQAEFLVDGNPVPLTCPQSEIDEISQQQEQFRKAIQAINTITLPFMPLCKTRFADLKVPLQHFQYLQGFAEGSIANLEKDRQALLAVHEDRMRIGRLQRTEEDAKFNGDWDEDEDEPAPPPKAKTIGKK